MKKTIEVSKEFEEACIVEGITIERKLKDLMDEYVRLCGVFPDKYKIRVGYHGDATTEIVEGLK